MMPWRLGLQDSASRAFRGPSGVEWTVEVRALASSNAMVVFLHPDRVARQDRYAWWISNGAEAHDPRRRLQARAVLDQLDDRTLTRLFRKSMAVDSRVPRFEPG